MAAGGECWLQRPPSFSGQADRPRGSWWECRVPPAPTCRCLPFTPPALRPGPPRKQKGALNEGTLEEAGQFFSPRPSE